MAVAGQAATRRLGAGQVMGVGDRWGWLKALRDGDDGGAWPRRVWLDFLGACAIAALMAAVLSLAQGS